MPSYGRITYGAPAERGDTTNSKGLIRGSGYSPKPSYYAYQNVCALFDAHVRKADFHIHLGAAAPDARELAIHTAAYSRRNRPMYARIGNPVVVDLLTGAVTTPGKASLASGCWRFR